MKRREFTRSQREQIVKRATNERREMPRSKSANFKWLEQVVSGEWPEHCIDWPFAKRGTGYGTIFWKGTRTTSHRVACELAYGPPTDSKMHAAHSCGNRSCCNPAHLGWSTVRENSMDKVKHGTYLYGERTPASRLTYPQVRQIRSLLKRGYSLHAIGRLFEVSPGTIWDIKAGKSWRGNRYAA